MSNEANDEAAFRGIDPNRGRPCAHCLRRCGTYEGGYARIQGMAVCSRPPAPGRPDCYQLVTAHGHPLRECMRCLDPAALVIRKNPIPSDLGYNLALGRTL